MRLALSQKLRHPDPSLEIRAARKNNTKNCALHLRVIKQARAMLKL